MWITRFLYLAYGLASGYMWAYVGPNAYRYGFVAWLDAAAVAAILTMLAHRPLLVWTWGLMKRRFVRYRYGENQPAVLPFWGRRADYPAGYVLTCFGLILESKAPSGTERRKRIVLRSVNWIF